MLNMTPSPWLYDFLKAREAFRPTAYRPTKHDVWTIGYGHTKGVNYGDTCSIEQAGVFLQQDVAWAVAAVNRGVTVPLTQPQFDALVSFVYNVGAEAFFASTLLRQLDAKDYTAAANDLLAWDHQAGVVLDGLKTRREQERTRFLAAA